MRTTCTREEDKKETCLFPHLANFAWYLDSDGPLQKAESVDEWE